MIYAVQNKGTFLDYLSFSSIRKKYTNQEIEITKKGSTPNSVFSKSTYICYDLTLIDLNKCLKDLGDSTLIIFSSFDEIYKFPKEVQISYSRALNKQSILRLINDISNDHKVELQNPDEIYLSLKKYISTVPDELLINSIHISLISGISIDNIFSKSEKEYEILLDFLDSLYQYLLNPIIQNEAYYLCIKRWLSIEEKSRFGILEQSLQYLIKATLIPDSTTDFFQKKIKQYDSIKDSKIMRISIELSKLLLTFEKSECLGIQKFLTNIGEK